MADPICRWRNPSLKTVRELIDVLPKEKMEATKARELINEAWGKDDFFRTPYQLACQLGLYAEINGYYYPQFSIRPTLAEVLDYLKNWLINYYVPNPYTLGFSQIEPNIIHNKLCEFLLEKRIPLDWEETKNLVFQEKIGNDDILRNTLNRYSDVIEIQKGILDIKEGTEYDDLANYVANIEGFDRKDKETFIAQFATKTRSVVISDSNLADFKHNLLLYGAPGTGKSYTLEERSAPFSSRRKRVTFYPDYSYAKFVGSYKPSTYYKHTGATYSPSKTTQQDGYTIVNEPVIDYTFVPGPFLQALVEVYKSPQPYLLIIEEINRANAAAVFGEVFQLLDRENGESVYRVMLSDEAMQYLRNELGAQAHLIEEGIYIPQNLYLWATMNSADQGVFHMDAAFKRRWHFEYLPLNRGEAVTEPYQIKFCAKEYRWNGFRKEINNFLSANKVAEDRLLGPFFLSQEELMDEQAVKNKLLVYLRDDVLRHNPRILFKHGTFSEIIEHYEHGDIFQDALADQLSKIAIRLDADAKEADQ